MEGRIILTQRALMSPYGILLLFFVLCGLDLTLWNRALMRFLPLDPKDWGWYGVVFGLPHIVGSFISIADKEYWRFYKPTLRRVVPWSIALAVLVSLVLPLSLGLLLFNCITAYHTIGQQAGLSRSFLLVAGKVHDHWRRVVNVLACLLPLELAFSAAPDVGGNDLYACIDLGVAILAVLSTALALLIWRQQALRSAAGHLMCTQALLLSFVMFIYLGYPAFAVMAAQVVHDVTAFLIYANHDRARMSVGQNRNWFYGLLRARKGQVALVLILTSVILAFIARHPDLAVLALSLSFAHYFFEGSAWRRASLHRRHLGFSR